MLEKLFANHKILSTANKHFEIMFFTCLLLDGKRRAQENYSDKLWVTNNYREHLPSHITYKNSKAMHE